MDSRVGNKIKSLRTSKDMTCKQLGRKLGVSEKYIAEIENGEKIVNEAMLQRMSKILGEGANMVQDDRESFEKSFEKKPQAPKKASPKPKPESNDRLQKVFDKLIFDVPVYNLTMKKVLYNEKFIAENNKIHYHDADKIFGIKIENDELSAMGIAKNDVLYFSEQKDIDKNGYYLIKAENTHGIRMIKTLENNQVLMYKIGNILKHNYLDKKKIKAVGKLLFGHIDFTKIDEE